MSGPNIKISWRKSLSISERDKVKRCTGYVTVEVDCRLPFGTTQQEVYQFIHEQLRELDIDYTIQPFGFRAMPIIHLRKIRFVRRLSKTSLMSPSNKRMASARELAKELGLNHTNVYRILSTFEENRFLVRAGLAVRENTRGM
jgi:acetylornithine deacetylase/succinyl-diaminopimelate desuccinylase-like protein